VLFDKAAAVGQTIAAGKWGQTLFSGGGKSELRRVVRRVTPGQGDLKDSGTENTPPDFACFASFVGQACEGLPAVARRAEAGKGEKVR